MTDVVVRFAFRFLAPIERHFGYVIDWFTRWIVARQTDRPLPVPSTPLGLRRKGES